MKVRSRTPLHLLADTCDIERRDASPTPGRYPAEVWSTAAEDVSCALQPMKSAKRAAYGADRAPRMYTVFFAPGVGVLPSDRLKIVSNGTVYRLLVRSAPIDLVEGGAVLEVDAEHLPGVSS